MESVHKSARLLNRPRVDYSSGGSGAHTNKIVWELSEAYDPELAFDDDTKTNLKDLWATMINKNYAGDIKRHVKPHTDKEHNIALLWVNISEDAWRSVVRLPEPRAWDRVGGVDGVNLAYVRDIVKRNVQPLQYVAPGAANFVEVADVWVQVDNTAPLWWLPLSYWWVQKPYNPASLYNFHKVHRNVRNLMVDMLSLGQNTFSLYDPTGTEGSMCSNIMHAISEEILSSIRFYKPLHRLFVMRTPHAGWGLFIGIEEQKLLKKSNHILVPQYAVLVYMTGELKAKDATGADNYAVDVGNNIMCTCWYGDGRPLVGGTGFFANHSCSPNRLLLPIQQTNITAGGRPMSADEVPIVGVGALGISVELALARNLYRADFEPSGADNQNKDGLMLQRVDVNGTYYRVLPLETDYKYSEGQPVRCECQTRCWCLDPRQKSMIKLQLSSARG